MPRGFTWAIYTDDLGNPWALQVDSDYFHMLDRGWPTEVATGLFGLPRGWRPRKVVGIEDAGIEHLAIAASLDAPIWTGLTPTFTINDNTGQPVLCTIIGHLDEHRAVPTSDTGP